jgi:hypothetical protein
MEHLQRLNDWRARLDAEIERQRHSPFAWGRQDCAIGFAASIVQAITGKDLARGYRGKYSTPTGALRLLASIGAQSLGDLAAIMLPEIHPSRADVGDIAVIEADGPGGEAFAMVDSSGLVVMTKNGHGRRPRHDMKRAFKVG